MANSTAPPTSQHAQPGLLRGDFGQLRAPPADHIQLSGHLQAQKSELQEVEACLGPLTDFMVGNLNRRGQKRQLPQGERVGL